MSIPDQDVVMADCNDTADDHSWRLEHELYEPPPHMSGVWPQDQQYPVEVDETPAVYVSLLDRVEPRDHIDWEPLKPVPLGPASDIADREATQIVLSERPARNHSEYHPDHPHSAQYANYCSPRQVCSGLQPIPEESLRCCGKTFVDATAIYQHQVMKHFDNLMCYLCERHFPHSSAARNHMQVKHPMLYARTYRGQMFASPSSSVSRPPPRYYEPHIPDRSQHQKKKKKKKKSRFSVGRDYNFRMRPSTRY